MHTINTKQGDLFSLNTGIIVHGCNARGVMGAGFAKEIRNRYPAAFAAYRKKYEEEGLELGDAIIVPVKFLNGHPTLYVVNAVTQQFYGRDPLVTYVDYAAVYQCFLKVRDLAASTGLPVHFPRIGCGLANGVWNEVAKAIESAMGDPFESTLWLLPGM